MFSVMPSLALWIYIRFRNRIYWSSILVFIGIQSAHKRCNTICRWSESLPTLLFRFVLRSRDSQLSCITLDKESTPVNMSLCYPNFATNANHLGQRHHGPGNLRPPLQSSSYIQQSVTLQRVLYAFLLNTLQAFDP